MVAADPRLDAALGAEAAEHVVALLPHGRLLTIPGARHAVHASKPREFAQAVRESAGGLIAGPDLPRSQPV